MLALARKYRPRSFATVAVQSHVSNTLKGAIARGRVAHGYLLCGPRGVGKTTLARVLAMALNCEQRASDGEPCGTCTSCTRIWSGSASLDVVEIDAASNRSVEDARELRERAMYAPSGDDRYKVYIVDEAHMLTREAWNTLLKILEEPPPRVIFVFATTEPEKIAQAAAPVLSRLQRFDFRRIGPAEVRDRLAAVLAEEGVPAEPEALAMIGRAADGSLRDALSLTDQALSLGDGPLTADRVREALGLVAEDEFLAILDLIAEHRAGDVFAVVGRLAEQGIDFVQFLAGLGDMLRAQLAVVLGAAATDVSDRARTELEARRDRFAAGDILRMLTIVSELEPRFRKSGQQQMLLETLLIRFALLDRTVDLTDVLSALGSGGGAPGASGAAAGAPRAGAGAGAGSGGVQRGAAGIARDAAPAPASRPARAPRPADVAGDAGSSAVSRDTGPVARDPAPATRADARGGSPQSRHLGAAATALDTGGVLVAEPEVRPAPRAAAAPAADAGEAPPLNAIVERWDEIAERVLERRKMLGSMLGHAEPVSVTGAGVLTLSLDDDASAEGLQAGSADVLAAVRTIFPGVKRISIRRGDAKAGAAGPRRLSEEETRRERLAMLRKRDPVLGAAIDALDLELLD